MKEFYLDNAATMEKIPDAVKAEMDFYANVNANPLRGLYKKSVQATTEVEACRNKVLELVHADNSYTVIFSRGTTEALNLLANGLIISDDGFGVVSKDDKIVVDIESHHSNILSWNQRYKNVILSKDISKDTVGAKVVSLTGVSNVTGEDLSERCIEARMKSPEAIIGLDAAQMVGHSNIDVKRLRIDFMAFSGHKFGAPMGIGGLVIKKSLAEKIRPLNYGGEMVDIVSVNGEPCFSEIPYRLEAGTLSVGAIYGLSRALDFWLNRDISVDRDRLSKVVSELREVIETKFKKEVDILASNGNILTFNVHGVHPHDVAQIFSNRNIAVRAGYLCAQPYLEYRGWGPVVRISLSIFDLDRKVEIKSAVIDALNEVIKTFHVGE